MKFLRRIIFLIIILVVVSAVAVGKIGYDYYQEVLGEKSFDARIEELQNDKNFVKYDALAEDYINAVLATEDHRFFDHGAVDVISIARAIRTNISNKEFKEGRKYHNSASCKKCFFHTRGNYKKKISRDFCCN